jgi:HEAT repeat protein
MPTFYCWHCYAAQPSEAGACPTCGQPIAAPPGTSWTQQLLWSLQHPLVERRMLAIAALAALGERAAVEPLTELATKAADPYLAARAVQALMHIEGVEPIRPLLTHLLRDGPAPVREVVRRALREP